LSLACVKADAATLFTVFDVFLLDNNFEALDATDFDVCSFLDFAMIFGFKAIKSPFLLS